MIKKDEETYLYIEDKNECNICYETKNNFFQCKQCVFMACPKCFNQYYFIEETSKCPMCRYC